MSPKGDTFECFKQKIQLTNVCVCFVLPSVVKFPWTEGWCLFPTVSSSGIPLHADDWKGKWEGGKVSLWLEADSSQKLILILIIRKEAFLVGQWTLQGMWLLNLSSGQIKIACPWKNWLLLCNLQTKATRQISEKHIFGLGVSKRVWLLNMRACVRFPAFPQFEMWIRSGTGSTLPREENFNY